MDPYTQTYQYYPASPSMSCNYANYPPTPTHTTTSYCNCCCSSMPYYQPPAFIFSPPTSPFIPQIPQVSSSTPSPPASSTTTTAKSARLQYSNRDRYVLNELFKRTPYPNAIQRDIIARQLGISQEQIRIWFQNRRRLQTQRDNGERLATTNELLALQQGKSSINANDLRQLLTDVIKYKNAPPRLRLDESS